MTSNIQLAIYYEGGTVDRHWLAPAGLSMTEAKEQRVGRRYKTAWGAQQALSRYHWRERANA